MPNEVYLRQPVNRVYQEYPLQDVWLALSFLGSQKGFIYQIAESIS
jgi:hypothetical protein